MAGHSDGGGAVARYLQLLRAPQARLPVVTAFVGRMPTGMTALGIVLLIQDASGSFAIAGQVAAAFGLAIGIGSVAQGRLMDRRGQTMVLLPCALLHVTSMLALVLAAVRDWPVVALAGCAALAGATEPRLSAAMRSLWTTLVEEGPARQAAYALESVVIEVAFLVGPLLVAVLVTLGSPAAAVLAAGLLAGGGTLGFVATRPSRHWHGQLAPTGWAGALRSIGLRVLMAATVLTGLAMGLVEVGVPSFAVDRSAPGLAGVLMAVLSAGSTLGGLLYGGRSWPLSPGSRLAAFEGVFAAALAASALATQPLAFAALLLPAGLAFAPITVGASAMLDRLAPAGTLTEASTWLTTAMFTGVASGNAVGGVLVQAGGTSLTLFTAAAGMTVGVLVTLAGIRFLSEPPERAPART